MAFHEVRFPTDISYGSSGGPEFSTEIVTFGSGHEQRNQNWEFPRQRWNVAYGIQKKSQLDAVREFFFARCGKVHGFRFKSHDDYQAELQKLLPIEGETAKFQLAKQYEAGSYTFDRKIVKPCASPSVRVWDDAAEVTETVSVDYATGVVTFNGGAPGPGSVLIATFDFDIPVRFDTDYLPVSLDAYLARSVTINVLEYMI